ncbi:hypothetical protein [Nostoc sp. WHI]|nr:hypothetical protein [Nostoc sp. WHI]
MNCEVEIVRSLFLKNVSTQISTTTGFYMELLNQEKCDVYDGLRLR